MATISSLRRPPVRGQRPVISATTDTASPRHRQEDTAPTAAACLRPLLSTGGSNLTAATVTDQPHRAGTARTGNCTTSAGAGCCDPFPAGARARSAVQAGATPRTEQARRSAGSTSLRPLALRRPPIRNLLVVQVRHISGFFLVRPDLRPNGPQMVRVAKDRRTVTHVQAVGGPESPGVRRRSPLSARPSLRSPEPRADP